ncbi:hypothetical protein V1527DRAFT_475318 [Lipomyces starkeyi]
MVPLHQSRNELQNADEIISTRDTRDNEIRKLHVRPSVHQLALIAANRRDELRTALGRSRYYSISQLCHNQQCFNPEHLIVESNSDIRKRKACKGKTIIVHEGFTDLHRVYTVELRICINASYQCNIYKRQCRTVRSKHQRQQLQHKI